MAQSLRSSKPSKEFPLRNVGIFRNLPSFDPSIQGLTAIVTGATGISGWNTVRSLLENPGRWRTVYVLSRCAPSDALMQLLSEKQRACIQHISVDFLTSPEEIAKALKDAGGVEDTTHIFCYAYLQPPAEEGERLWSNAEKLCEVNETIFSNFLKALPLAHIQPQRILLQTGGKNYGMQMGRVRFPCVESDPQPKHLGPNFYYLQEDLLYAYCKEHTETSWNVVMPFAIIGASDSIQMNTAYIFAVYAAVQAQKGEPLRFPGDWSTWQLPAPLSTARLTGFLSEWVILEEDCRNQHFNAEDSNLLSLDRLYCEMSRWYCGNGEDVVPPTSDESTLEKLELKGGEDSPLGYGPNAVTRSSFTMTEWAKNPANSAAWKQIMDLSKDGKITKNPFEDEDAESLFGIADVFWFWPPMVSMNKARRFGWTGYVDSIEGFYDAVVDMAAIGLLPPVIVDAARPLVC